MKTSLFGTRFIEIMEGRRLESYQDSKGIWTIGVGHTKGVTSGMSWTPKNVEWALQEDLEEAEIAINSLGVDLTQPQFDALVSLAFNIGVGAFGASAVASELRKLRYRLAADAMLLWNDKGLLTERRQAERGIFLYGTTP